MLTTLRVGPRPVAVSRLLLAAGGGLTSYEGAILVADLRDGEVTVPVVGGLPGAESFPLLPWLALMVLATCTFLFGVLPRASAGVLAGGNAALLLVDQQLYSNHRYLVVLLCLWFVFARSDHAFAIGAGRRRARGGGRVPWWPQLLVVATVSSCYLFAGLGKANPEFLSGELIASLAPDWVPARLTALATVVTETAIGVALWFRRTRLAAIVLALGLHASIIALLDSPMVFTAFALVCMAAYPLALRWPHSAPAAATQRSSVA